MDARGHRVAYGLCPGSSDLIGWTPRIIAGRQVAIFTAIEVKRPGRRASEKQQRFIEAVCAAGGIGAVATSPQQAAETVRRFQP